MINFDGVDFSESRSEEVMFLLTLSVLSLWASVPYMKENVLLCTEGFGVHFG